MNFDQAIQKRIISLYAEKAVEAPDVSVINGETTIDTIEQFCGKLGISIADFFVNDLFRGLEPN